MTVHLLHGEPWNYSILVERYKRNNDGSLVIKDGEVQKYVKEYRIGGLKWN